MKIQESDIHKSGYNKFANFKYWELKDFLAPAKKAMHTIGLTSCFCINEDTATLTIYNCNDGESIAFSTLTAEDENKQIKNPIQLLGCKITYLRRYLWINALELTENDSVDSRDNNYENNNQAPPEQYSQPQGQNTPPKQSNYNSGASSNLASDKQRKMIYAITKAVDMSTEQSKELIYSETGKSSSKELTKTEASKVITGLKVLQDGN